MTVDLTKRIPLPQQPEPRRPWPTWLLWVEQFSKVMAFTALASMSWQLLWFLLTAPHTAALPQFEYVR